MDTHPCAFRLLSPHRAFGQGKGICDREVNADSEYKSDLPSPAWVRQTWSLKSTISKLCGISFWIPKITPKFTLLKNQALQTSFPWKESSLSFLPQNNMRNTYSISSQAASGCPSLLPRQAPLPRACLKCHLFYWIDNLGESPSRFVDEKVKFKPATCSPFFSHLPKLLRTLLDFCSVLLLLWFLILRSRMSGVYTCKCLTTLVSFCPLATWTTKPTARRCFARCFDD